MCSVSDPGHEIMSNEREIRPGSLGNRFLGAILDGGKSGVDMGMAIIPGVLIICTIVLMLTNGPGENGVYTGEAYEGVGLLPYAMMDTLGCSKLTGKALLSHTIGGFCAGVSAHWIYMLVQLILH